MRSKFRQAIYGKSLPPWIHYWCTSLSNYLSRQHIQKSFGYDSFSNVRFHSPTVSKDLFFPLWVRHNRLQFLYRCKIWFSREGWRNIYIYSDITNPATPLINGDEGPTLVALRGILAVGIGNAPCLFFSSLDTSTLGELIEKGLPGRLGRLDSIDETRSSSNKGRILFRAASYFSCALCFFFQAAATFF